MDRSKVGGQEDRRRGGQKDRRIGGHVDKRTGGQEDRRTGGQHSTLLLLENRKTTIELTEKGTREL